MANDFTGPVQLLDDHGAVVEQDVQAALNKHQKSGLWQWGGHLGPHKIEKDWTAVTQVKLHSGEVGTVILTQVTIRNDVFGTNQTAWATGSGPAPF